jgi:hypothetical protein
MRSLVHLEVPAVEASPRGHTHSASAASQQDVAGAAD